MNEIPGGALNLHSCRYFHSPSAMRVMYVSGSEKGTCLWLLEAMPLGCCIWKYPRRHSGQEGPKLCLPSGNSCVLSHELSSHNGTSISEAAPTVEKCAWGRVFQNAYTIEMYASLKGMTFSVHSNANTS